VVEITDVVTTERASEQGEEAGGGGCWTGRLDKLAASISPAGKVTGVIVCDAWLQA